MPVKKALSSPAIGAQGAPPHSDKRDAATKIAKKRLSVLELAQELGSVTKACKQAGMDRTSFYEWKRRFQAQGLVGLKDLPPIPASHPNTTPEDIQERIAEMAILHPTKGCKFLSDTLALEGIRISSVTVQAILNKRELGHRYGRLLEVERKALNQREFGISVCVW